MKNDDMGNYSDIDSTAEDKAQKLLSVMDYLSATKEVIFWRKQTIQLLDIAPDAMVLNLGCGLGDWSRLVASHLSEKGKVIGLDYSQTMLNEAIQRAKYPQESYQQGDAHQLPFEDNSFDNIFCERVLHHLEDPQQALAECYRVLKNSGRALFVEPVFHNMFLHPASLPLSRYIADVFFSEVKNGDVGLKLPEYTQASGFKELEYLAYINIWRDFNKLNDITNLTKVIEEYDHKTAENNISTILKAEKLHQFLFSVPLYIICVEK